MNNGRWMAVAVVLLGFVAIGCSSSKSKSGYVPPPSRYPALPAAKLPPYFRDMILERAVVSNTEPYIVSGFGLVVNLANTGDSTAPTTIRDHIFKEIQRHGFGSNGRGTKMQPEEVLRDKRVAIVQVDAFIPPGARRNQRIDVMVSALPSSYTTSLARGHLYRTDLALYGANPMSPASNVNPAARAEGPVFVNPAYSLQNNVNQSSVKASLRNGVVMDGGVVVEPRPIHLRMRQPQYSMTRAIQERVLQRFRDKDTAVAMDDGIVQVYVPDSYGNDWQHFASVVSHLFMNGSPEFAAMKAKQLADEAVKPDAPLLDISYAWEGLDVPALPFITPLMTHSSPDVAFAAARAAAFLGDNSAQAALMEIAQKKDHPFQLAAVQVLAKLPTSASLNAMMRRLLESEQTTVRLEAYRSLAAKKDSSIFSEVINEKFILDIVPSGGKPLIYASRQGLPRIAILGDRPSIQMPLTFMAMDNQLTITDSGRYIKIFYRGTELRQPVQVLSRPEIAEVIARLGGRGAPGQPALNFTYGDVVAIVAALSDAKRLYAQSHGQTLAASFVLQESPEVVDTILNAPPIPGTGRPQGDKPAPVGTTQP